MEKPELYDIVELYYDDELKSFIVQEWVGNICAMRRCGYNYYHGFYWDNNLGFVV